MSTAAPDPGSVHAVEVYADEAGAGYGWRCMTCPAIHAPLLNRATAEAEGQRHAKPQLPQAAVVVCLKTCWNCKFGHHYMPPQWHTWADADDMEHARSTGQPDPSTRPCGCVCADPAREQPDWGPLDDDGLDTDGDEPVDVVSYTQEPCPACGETGACAWDSEGRPLIHAIPVEEDQ